MEENNPSLSDVLASNYLLASLHVRIWSGKKADKEAAKEFLTSKGAAQDAAVVVKNLLAGNDTKLKEVKAAYTRVRSFFYRDTAPWTAVTSGPLKGDRLLATRKSMAFLSEFAKLKKQAEDALTEFVTQYEQAVQSAAKNLGALHDATQYPSKAEVASLFDAKMELKPVPSVTDFDRLNIPASLVQGLQGVYERATERQMDNALSDVQARLLEELERTATQLSKIERGEKTRLFGTMKTNLERMVQMAREINFKKAPEIEALADEIEVRLLKVELADYKDNVPLARKGAKDAAELAKKVSASTWRVSSEDEPEQLVAPAPAPVAAPEVTSEEVVKALDSSPEPEAPAQDDEEDEFLRDLLAEVNKDLGAANEDLEYSDAEAVEGGKPGSVADSPLFDDSEVFF